MPLKSVQSVNISLQAEAVAAPPSIKELPRHTKVDDWQIDTNDDDHDHNEYHDDHDDHDDDRDCGMCHAKRST